MKKVLALLAVAMLLTASFALAESGPNVYQVGPFQFTIFAGDIAVYNEDAKITNETLLTIYPNYDPSSSAHPNIDISWTSFVLTTDLGMTPMEFAQYTLDSAVSILSAQGVTVTSPEVYNAMQDEASAILVCLYSMELDMTGSGNATTLIQEQLYVPVADDGTYVFTLTADNGDDILTLFEYITAGLGDYVSSFQ